MSKAVRRAFCSVDLRRWIETGKLPVEILSGTAILYTTAGKTVWQRYFNRKKTRRLGQSVYIRKGCFLEPHRVKVSPQELAFWEKNRIDLNTLGIFFDKEENLFYRYDFHRVTDLEHLIRRQYHVLDHYLASEGFNSVEELLEFVTKPRPKIIVRKVSNRRNASVNLRTRVKADLERWRRNLQSIYKHAPPFTKTDVSEREIQAVCSGLRRYHDRCVNTCYKPVGHKLRYAASSLQKAIDHLENGRYDAAKRCLSSAIRNIAYPESTKSQTP